MGVTGKVYSTFTVVAMTSQSDECLSSHECSELLTRHQTDTQHFSKRPKSFIIFNSSPDRRAVPISYMRSNFSLLFRPYLNDECTSSHDVYKYMTLNVHPRPEQDTYVPTIFLYM